MKKLITVLLVLFFAGQITAQEKTELKTRQEQRALELRSQFTTQFSEANDAFDATILVQPFLLTQEEMRLITPQTHLSLALELIKLKPKWYQFRLRKKWKQTLYLI